MKNRMEKRREDFMYNSFEEKIFDNPIGEDKDNSAMYVAIKVSDISAEMLEEIELECLTTEDISYLGLALNGFKKGEYDSINNQMYKQVENYISRLTIKDDYVVEGLLKKIDNFTDIQCFMVIYLVKYHVDLEIINLPL